MYGQEVILLDCMVLLDPSTKKIYGNAYAATSRDPARMIAQYGPPSHGFTDRSGVAHVIWPETVPWPRCIFFDDIGSALTDRLKRFVSHCVLRLKLRLLARRGRIIMAETGPCPKRVKRV